MKTRKLIMVLFLYIIILIGFFYLNSNDSVTEKGQKSPPMQVDKPETPGLEYIYVILLILIIVGIWSVYIFGFW